MSSEIEAKRKEVVAEIEDILDDIQEITGDDLRYIRRNTLGARDKLLDDGEYNYNVRVALNQIRRYVESADQTIRLDDIGNRVDELNKSLEDKAGVSPPSEITRT